MQALEAFSDVVQRIKASFPWLVVQEAPNPAQLEALAEMPVQPGLSLPIQLNLQNNDEMHLVVSNLWVEWFPCTESANRDAVVRAVSGFVSGELEIEEIYVLGKPAMATLRHRSRMHNPHHLARWSNLLTLLPLPRRRRIVFNQREA